MKVQPNFSWQKYEGKPEDEKKQFQYQLQQQHISSANAINATIDDASYWTRERQTGFTWIDGAAIWTKTITGVIVASTTTSYPLGVTGIQTVVSIQGVAQAQVPLTGDALPLPFVDPVTALNGIGIYVTGTNLNINAGNGAFAGFLFHVTVSYTKAISEDE